MTAKLISIPMEKFDALREAADIVKELAAVNLYGDEENPCWREIARARDWVAKHDAEVKRG